MSILDIAHELGARLPLVLWIAGLNWPVVLWPSVGAVMLSTFQRLSIFRRSYRSTLPSQ